MYGKKLRIACLSNGSVSFPGFVGVFNMVLLWPGLLILDQLHVETFEWPDRRQWFILVLNGLIGTVVSELLWLWYVICNK